MQLNETTLAVLKNFATIQPNIVLSEGAVVKTIAEAKNVMAVANLDQSFDKSVGIYNLDEFLAVLGLVDAPELAFGDDFVTVADSTGRSSIKYFYSDASILTSPAKDIPMPEAEVTFTLDAGTLNRVRRAAAALGHEKMTITAAWRFYAFVVGFFLCLVDFILDAQGVHLVNAIQNQFFHRIQFAGQGHLVGGTHPNIVQKVFVISLCQTLVGFQKLTHQGFAFFHWPIAGVQIWMVKLGQISKGGLDFVLRNLASSISEPKHCVGGSPWTRVATGEGRTVPLLILLPCWKGIPMIDHFLSGRT